MSVSSWRQVVGELMECSQIFHVAIGYEISVSLLTYSSNNVFFMLAVWMYLDRVVKLARAIILYLRDLRLDNKHRLIQGNPPCSYTRCSKSALHAPPHIKIAREKSCENRYLSRVRSAAMRECNH